MKQLVKAYRLLDAREQRQAWVVLAIVTVMALFDTLGTVSIMPFLAVLANPGLIKSNAILAGIYDFLGSSGTESFLIFLGSASFALLITSASVRTVGLFLVNRFTMMRSFSIASRLMDTYLRQPYAYYLNRHTGDMAKDLLSEISLLVTQVYQPATNLFAQSALLVVLVTLLVAVNPGVALIGILVLVVSYGGIYLVIRRYIGRAGRERVQANKERYRITAEALGGIKTIKLLGREAYYRDAFSTVTRRFSQLQAMNSTLSMVPRYTIEAIAFGGVILLTLALMVKYRDSATGPLAQILPLLGFYAFSGYRILPAVQGIYQAVTQLRFGEAALDSISEDLAGRDALPVLHDGQVEALPFHHDVALVGLGFTYPKSDSVSLHDISLTIPAGSTLGIVGSTGAGKTTLVDLFLGLLAADKGEIRVDGTVVTPQNLRAWQADLGYVPQDIFLLDASVAENIALGLKPADIDHDRVREAARMAQILDFIESQMPEGFATKVGERGVRLSGGQRQRIGIARALYNDPGIIVFDEATSALDNLTEQEVVRAIGALSGSKTILLIAHRISTVRNCNQILVLERGRMIGLGSYADLYQSNEKFRSLVDGNDVI